MTNILYVCLVISAQPAILTKCLSLVFHNHTLQQQTTLMLFPLLNDALGWTCPWLSWLDVHVVLARNLASHHKLAAAIKNEVVSCRQSYWEKSSLSFSMLPYNQMQTKPFFFFLKKYLTTCQVVILFPHFAVRNKNIEISPKCPPIEDSQDIKFHES